MCLGPGSRDWGQPLGSSYHMSRAQVRVITAQSRIRKGDSNIANLRVEEELVNGDPVSSPAPGCCSLFCPDCPVPWYPVSLGKRSLGPAAAQAATQKPWPLLSEQPACPRTSGYLGFSLW